MQRRPTATHKNQAVKDLRVVRDVFCFGGFLNLHVAELIGVENLAAFHAFNILDVFLAGDDTDFGVFAGGVHLEV